VAYVTLSEARSAGATRWVTKSLAESALRTAAAAPTSTDYDIFLSHSREDAQVIAGVKTLLERERVSVYVYWAEENAAAPLPRSFGCG
jgi:SH3-like domain-containing protein